MDRGMKLVFDSGKLCPLYVTLTTDPFYPRYNTWTTSPFCPLYSTWTTDPFCPLYSTLTTGPLCPLYITQTTGPFCPLYSTQTTGPFCSLYSTLTTDPLCPLYNSLTTDMVHTPCITHTDIILHMCQKDHIFIMLIPNKSFHNHHIVSVNFNQVNYFHVNHVLLINSFHVWLNNDYMSPLTLTLM